MTIDPKTLPADAVVEVGQPDAMGAHLTKMRPETATHIGCGSLHLLRVFVPVPDGVAYDDALRAVEDARPWVLLPDGLRTGERYGARVRAAYRLNSDVTVTGVVHMVTNDARVYIRGLGLTMRSSDWVWSIHPDDVPDPDASVIERMAEAISDKRGLVPWTKLTEPGRDAYRETARAALAAYREEGQ